MLLVLGLGLARARAHPRASLGPGCAGQKAGTVVALAKTFGLTERGANMGPEDLKIGG